MNYINIAFLAIMGICLFFGFILGIKRGIGKAIIRLIVVVAVIAVVFLFREKIGDVVLNLKIGSQTIQEFIISKIPEDYRSMEDTIIPIVKLIIIVVGFVVGVLVLKLVSLIVSAILGGIFAREPKARLIGGIIGLLQGAIVALAILVPLAGVCASVAKIEEIEMDDKKLLTLPAKADPSEAVSSGAGKILYEKGNFLYVKIASTKTEDGKTLTLEGQVDAFVAAAKMANELMKVKDFDFSGGLTSENVSKIKETLASLDEINGELSEEAQETITNLITDLADTFDVDVDLSGLDLTTINFSNEGEILDDIVSYMDSEGDVDPTKLVNDIANSDLAFTLLEASDAKIELDAAQELEVKNAIDALEDAEKAAKLKELFGIE